MHDLLDDIKLLINKQLQVQQLANIHGLQTGRTGSYISTQHPWVLSLRFRKTYPSIVNLHLLDHQQGHIRNSGSFVRSTSTFVAESSKVCKNKAIVKVKAKLVQDIL